MAEAAGNRAWDSILMALLVGSVVLVFWHASSEDAGVRTALEWIDAGLCVLFLAEWAWRATRRGAGNRWALRHSWELLGMVPLIAPVPGFLRILRLMRLVRIVRVFGRVGERVGVWERIAGESNLGKIALAGGAVTLVGATLVWLLERDAPGSKIPDFTTALWWAIVTVTTVGYGDVTPVTATGRFVAAGLMVVGIGTIALLASSLASVLILDKEDTDEARARDGAAPPGHAGALVRDLTLLAQLHEQGHLTDDEYRLAKQRVLH